MQLISHCVRPFRLTLLAACMSALGVVVVAVVAVVIVSGLEQIKAFHFPPCCCSCWHALSAYTPQKCCVAQMNT